MTASLTVEEPFYARGYHDSTLIHPLALGALLVLSVATVLVPRRWATFPVLLLACLIPSAQRLSLFGLDLTLLRLIVLAGWVRLLVKGEWRAIRFCRPDRYICWWAAVQATAYVLLHHTFGAFVYMSARMYEGLGTYFLFRALVRDWEDVKGVAKQLVLVSIPTGVMFLNEHFTRYNVFSVFGGVPAVTPIRYGRLRCFGAFDNPIVAGCFFATTVPLMVSTWWWRGGRYRHLALVGGFFSLCVVYACASSTPVAAIGAAILGGICFQLRWWMKEIRQSVVAMLVVLHIIMDPPVWHLLSRIDLVGGSTGWHRYNLVDQAIRRVDEWGLIGIKSTGGWGVQLFDVTNQYVLEGVYGGLGALFFFVMVLVTGFRAVGMLWRSVRNDHEKRAIAWSLGVCLYAHSMCFIAVSYFGQIIVAWYMVPALIASLAEPLWLARDGRRGRGARAPAQRASAAAAARIPRRARRPRPLPRPTGRP